MKREEIENKDQELIKKFRTIIRNKEKKKVLWKIPFGVLFFITVLIVSSMLLLKQEPSTHLSKSPQTLSQPPIVPVPIKETATEVDTVEIKATSDKPKVVTSPTKKVAKETVRQSSDVVLATPILEENSPEEVTSQGVQDDMPSGIRIEELISCSSVNNKQYSGAKSKFSLAQGATPVIWMAVFSQNPPSTLTHVYYVNERKYCQVPLAIRYRRMRTWSNVTLRSPDHIGKWRVEVIDDDGTKLDQIEFTVVR